MPNYAALVMILGKAEKMQSDVGTVILAELANLRSEVRALRADFALREINQKKPRQIRLERRRARLRELADATGMGITWGCATEILLMLCGKSPAPPGQESILVHLQKDEECPKSIRGIWRAISESCSDC